MSAVRIVPRRWLAAALIAGVCGVSWAGPAATDAITDPEIATVLSGLRDPAFLVRERASIDLQRMVESRRLTEGDLFALAARPDCTPEQRVRLINGARLAFMLTPRAGMGVQTREAGGAGGILVFVMENMPVGRLGLLRESDIIESIDGVDLSAVDVRNEADVSTIIRCIIVSHDPGDTIPLVRLRPPAGGEVPGDVLKAPRALEIDTTGWERAEIEVPLGSFGDLGNNTSLNSLELHLSWKLRWNRMLDQAGALSGPVAVEPVEGPVSIAEVPEAASDGELAGHAGRFALRDPMQTFSTYNGRTPAQIQADARKRQQLALNAAQAQRMVELQARGTAYIGDAEPAPEAAAAVDTGVVIRSMRDIELRLIEIERRIARQATGEDIAPLRDEHRELTEQLRALGVQLGGGVTR